MARWGGGTVAGMLDSRGSIVVESKDLDSCTAAESEKIDGYTVTESAEAVVRVIPNARQKHADSHGYIGGLAGERGNSRQASTANEEPADILGAL